MRALPWGVRLAASQPNAVALQTSAPFAAARFAGVRPAKGPLDLLLTGLTAGGGKAAATACDNPKDAPLGFTAIIGR